MKNIFILILFFCSIAFSQVNKIDGLYATNLDSNTNFVKNKSCATNINSITTSGTVTLTKDTTTKLDQGASCKAVATAAGQAIKFQVYNLDDKLQSGDCSTTAVYVGSTAGAFKTYLNLNGTKISLTEQQIVSSTTAKSITVYHTCNTGASNAYEVVFESTAAGTINVADVRVSKALTALPGILQAMQDAGTMTITGTSANPTKGGTVSNDVVRYGRLADRGVFRYEFKQTAAGTGGTGDYLFALPAGLQFDPNKVTYYTTVVGPADWPSQIALGSASAHDGSFAITGAIVPYDATRFRICGSGNNGSTSIRGCAAATNIGLSNATVTYTADFEAPILGWAGGDMTVNSRCPNDIACENVFTAKVSATGVVSDESLDWINGNCSAASPYTCTFNSNIFLIAPNCTVTATDTSGPNSWRINSLSASSVVVEMGNLSGTAVNRSFILTCSKAGSDFKPKQNIIGYLGTDRTERASLSNGGSCSFASTPSIGMSSTSFITTGQCRTTFATGAFSVAPTCVCSIAGGVNATCIAAPTSTYVDTVTYIGSTGATTNQALNVICVGPR